MTIFAEYRLAFLETIDFKGFVHMNCACVFIQNSVDEAVDDSMILKSEGHSNK